MRVKEAIILAGGLGTRLQGILPDLPKCMAPVNGKPFLTFVLDYLEVQGINKVILSVGYRNDQIINYFKNRYHSILIEYVIETEPLGTGGAV
jgi:D-glycero-alpha-D-manno-heptose 1-phosphate guanylyltransferase